LYRLNFAFITIIPKEKDARTMNKFRPISLLNCSYKIFTRVLTSKMTKVVDRLIASNQTAFIKARYILESVVTAHEILHSVHHNKSQGFVLKLDYEKAYDKVNWEFLINILEKRGFGGKWIDWIRCILHRGSMGLTINNSEGQFFQTGKGLRQGDPLSPILFNLVVDVLSRMLQKATNRGLMKELGNELIEGIVVQYADDIILLIENNETYARNLKWILTCFELMSGMRINFYKSELVPINIESEVAVNNWRMCLGALWGLSPLSI
jgi:retron-type reverse transcriptase